MILGGFSRRFTYYTKYKLFEAKLQQTVPTKEPRDKKKSVYKRPQLFLHSAPIFSASSDLVPCSERNTQYGTPGPI